jgi:hypothetical protein
MKISESLLCRIEIKCMDGFMRYMENSIYSFMQTNLYLNRCDYKSEYCCNISWKPLILNFNEIDTRNCPTTIDVNLSYRISVESVKLFMIFLEKFIF